MNPKVSNQNRNNEIVSEENKIKHLEFIQNAITRMGQNSFQMKGWAIAIVTALLALYAASYDNSTYIFIAIIPTLIFWVLDSYYLQQERIFRGIYNDVAELSDKSNRIKVKSFEMPIGKYKDGKYNIFSAMFSITEWLLYLVLIIGLATAGFVINNI